MKNQSIKLISLSLLLAILFAGMSPLTSSHAQISTVTPAPTPETLNIWPGLAPGEKTSSPGRFSDDGGNVQHLSDITCPQLTLYRLPGSNPRPTVVVMPGGGYSFLAADLEGSEVADWLNAQGFDAAVLHYRVPNNWTGAFQDGQRAISLLRARASEFGIDPRRLGVLGFSAGGHLAARVSCSYRTRSYPSVDRFDKASNRPDFTLLIYPAYLIDKTGKPSHEVQPRHDQSPVFLTQSLDDPYLDAPAYADGLQKAGVKTHLQVYATGGHGYGLRAPESSPVHAWPDAAAHWLSQFSGI